jgi:hypothetical protein
LSSAAHELGHALGFLHHGYNFTGTPAARYTIGPNDVHPAPVGFTQPKNPIAYCVDVEPQGIEGASFLMLDFVSEEYQVGIGDAIDWEDIDDPAETYNECLLNPAKFGR